MLDIGAGLSYEFVELKGIRDFHYEELNFDGVSIPKLNETVKRKIEELLSRPRRNPNKLPLVRLRLRGTLAKDASRTEFDNEAISQEFADRALVAISKDDLIAPGLEEKVKFLRELRERRLPVDEMAMQLLESNLKDVGYNQMFDARTIYELLSEGKGDEAQARVFEVVEKLVESELKGRKR
jgi:hypothetical protein